MSHMNQADDNALSHSEYKTYVSVSRSKLWTCSSEEKEWETQILKFATVLVAPREALLEETALAQLNLKTHFELNTFVIFNSNNSLYNTNAQMNHGFEI